MNGQAKACYTKAFYQKLAMTKLRMKKLRMIKGACQAPFIIRIPQAVWQGAAEKQKPFLRFALPLFPWPAAQTFPKPLAPGSIALQPCRRAPAKTRSEEHTSELQSRGHLVC